MEYQKADALLYDFVYLTVDSTDVMYRERMMDFFEYYKGKDNRSGKYLLPVDMSNPLFDGTLYDTIDDLKRKDEYGNTQLSLISKRIRKVIEKGKNIEQLIGFVTRKYYSLEDIRAMCQHLGISTSYFTDTVPAKIVVQLIDKLLEEDRIEEMVDLVAIEHPEIVNN